MLKLGVHLELAYGPVPYLGKDSTFLEPEVVQLPVLVLADYSNYWLGPVGDQLGDEVQRQMKAHIDQIGHLELVP